MVATCVDGSVRLDSITVRDGWRFQREVEDGYVEVMKDDERVDGKSVLSITSLCVEQGSAITILTSGKDAEAALDALSALIQQDFGREAAESA